MRKYTDYHQLFKLGGPNVQALLSGGQLLLIGGRVHNLPESPLLGSLVYCPHEKALQRDPRIG